MNKHWLPSSVSEIPAWILALGFAIPFILMQPIYNWFHRHDEVDERLRNND